MFGVSPCYGADDLMLQELGNQASRICNKPVTPMKINIPDMPKDAFVSKETKKTKLEHIAKIACGVLAATGLGYGGYKIFKHFKP